LQTGSSLNFINTDTITRTVTCYNENDDPIHRQELAVGTSSLLTFNMAGGFTCYDDLVGLSVSLVVLQGPTQASSTTKAATATQGQPTPTIAVTPTQGQSGSSIVIPWGSTSAGAYSAASGQRVSFSLVLDSAPHNVDCYDANDSSVALSDILNPGSTYDVFFPVGTFICYVDSSSVFVTLNITA
jgi:hypothetical protein